MQRRDKKIPFSLQLDEKNYDKLKNFSEANQVSCGKIINMLIEGMDEQSRVILSMGKESEAI